jgi:hypothetical protein
MEWIDFDQTRIFHDEKSESSPDIMRENSRALSKAAALLVAVLVVSATSTPENKDNPDSANRCRMPDISLEPELTFFDAQ